MDTPKLEAGDLDTPQSTQSQEVLASQVDLWSPDISLDKDEQDPFHREQIQQKTEESQPTSEELSVSSIPVISAPAPLTDSIISKSDTVATSFVSAVSQQPPSRHNPVPPYISPVHYQLPTRRWIETTVFQEVPFKDLLADTVSKAFASYSASQRPTRPIMVLEQALEYPDPYIPLIQSKSWRAVVQLARNDLVACHPTQVDQIMKFWHLRWTALLKLKLYDIIQTEMEKLKFTEFQDMVYENYKDIFPDRQGLMISFDCLFIMCKLPSLKGNHHESIHKVYRLLYPQKPWDFKPTKEQHLKLVLFVVHLLTQLPDYPLASKLLKQVLKSNVDNVDLWSTLGRMQLQQGDISSAIQSFIHVEFLLNLCKESETEFIQLPNVFPRPDLVLAQRGFVLFSQDKYLPALQYFTELLTLLPDNPSVMNNVAICHLYSGNVGQAASFLESFLVSHPQIGANYPEILFNLSSMYDLTDSSLSKKRALLKMILNNCGDDFDPECLKL